MKNASVSDEEDSGRDDVGDLPDVSGHGQATGHLNPLDDDPSDNEGDNGVRGKIISVSG